MKMDLILKKINVRLYGGIIPILLLFIWQVITSVGYLSPLILPPPAIVFKTFLSQFELHGLGVHILTSLKRVMCGFLIGSLTGVSFGLLIGLSRTAEKVFAPAFHVVRQIPMIGWIPLIVMWFGMNELPRIIVISMAAFYPTVLNTYAGVRNVPREYLELASVYGYKGLKLIRRVIIPSAFPSIITGISLSVGMSWAILMAAELFIDTYFGIGTCIEKGRSSFNMALVYVGIFTVGLLGYAMTAIVEKFVKAFDYGGVINREL